MPELLTIEVEEQLEQEETSGLVLGIREAPKIHTGSRLASPPSAQWWWWPWDDGDGFDGWWDADCWDGDGWWGDGWDGDT
jgi:hypothetical protein